MNADEERASQLILLPDDQVPYPELSNQVLLLLAIQQDEPFIATSALGELAGRRASEARRAAETILAAEPWDAHLLAHAMTILCDLDPAAAAGRFADVADEHPAILRAKVECVLSNVETFRAGENREVARRLASSVAKLGAAVIDRDRREELLGLFGQGAETQ